MSPSRILIPLLLILSTAAFADFHFESSSNHRDVDAAGNVALRVTVVNGTPALASNVQLFYPSDRATPATPGANCGANKCTLGALAPGESTSVDFRVAFDQPYGRKYLPVSAGADLAGKPVGYFAYVPVA